MSYSQNNSESDVFKKIIDYEIGKGGQGMYVQCEKPTTFFDVKVFKYNFAFFLVEKFRIGKRTC